MPITHHQALPPFVPVAPPGNWAPHCLQNRKLGSVGVPHVGQYRVWASGSIRGDHIDRRGGFRMLP